MDQLAAVVEWSKVPLLAGVAAIWELYKLVGPQAGGDVFGWRVIPKASDQAMELVVVTGQVFILSMRRHSLNARSLVEATSRSWPWSWMITPAASDPRPSA